jgi:hypothetical protein
MQILTVCSEPQQGRVTALATVDGVASGIYAFISKRLMNREPHLFIDMYIEQGNYIDVYGFSHLLNTRRNANQSVVNTYKGINGNMKNNASSNRSRTVSVNSASNGNRTISGNSASNVNRTISGNSGNSTTTNMAQPLRKKQKPVTNINKNTLSIASAIRNNKNNNEVTSRNKNAIAKMRTLNPKFNMGTNPKTKKKSFFPFPVRRKVTPTKPKPLLNQSINNARAELNKLTSLRQNQKINYLEKMKQDPTNIIRILNNAKRVASTQRATRSRTPARK